jgi:RNA polymerase sigma-70 factor, ECF subfamily
VSIFVKQSRSTAVGCAVATPPELDHALMREIAGGNKLAMRTLFLRHQVRVFRFILRIVRDRAQAEDVMSDVFLEVWQRADRFEGRSAVSTWLLSIARHKALTARKARPLEQVDDALVLAMPDPARDPEAEVGEKDRGAVLRQCLSALSPEHSEIIDLVYYQEKSIKEIAEILGIALNTVKTRMFYARKRLATLLAASGIETARA